MDVLSIILVVSLYPFIPILYFLLKHEGNNPRKGVYFGVSLDKEQAKISELQHITTEYNRQMKMFLWITLLMSVPMFFVPWVSVNYAYWCIWLLVVCVVFFIPFGIANKKLKELKHLKGWYAGEEDVSLTEIKVAGKIRKLKWYHFLVPTLICIGLLIWTIAFPRDEMGVLPIIMAATFGAVTLMFAAMGILMDKQKTEIISTDSDVNVNYARAVKNIWKNFWILLVWVNTIYTGGMLFSLLWEDGLSVMFWILTALYTMASIGLLIWAVQKKSRLDRTYEDKMDVKLRGDDFHWIWGMFYYNSKDKHIMVNKCVGTGTTINLATAAGKGTAIFLLLTLLCLPISSIALLVDEFTPIHLLIEENRVIAYHVEEDYSILLDDIEETELLTELPKIRKNHGTNTDYLLEGNFRIRGEGVSCKVFCNPQNTLFIRLETEDEIYLFSGFDDEETRLVYEAIQTN